MFFLPTVDFKRNFMEFLNLKNKINKWIDRTNLIYVFLFFLILVELSSFISLYFEVLDIKVWRHDELVMLDNGYLPKLKGEGRWINYLLFPYLKKVAPQIAIVVDLSCWTYFSFVLAKRYTNHILFSILFTLTSLQIPAYYSMIGWPVTVLPTMLILAFLTWLSSRVNPIVLFSLGGLLMFGGFNNFYNLLLLLVITPPQQRNHYSYSFNQSATANIKEKLKCFLYWIISYFVGFFIALIITKIIGGVWGLQIEYWRHPNRLDSFEDLIINFNLIKDGFIRHIRLLGPAVMTAIVGISSYLFIKDFVIHSTKKLFFPYLAILAVSLACYVQALPMGLEVYNRTAFPLFVAVFGLTLLIFNQYKLVGSFLCCILCLNCYLLNIESTHYFTTVTNTWYHQLKRLPVDKNYITALHFCGSNADIKQSEQIIIKSRHLKNLHTEGLGQVSRFAPAAKAAGFYNFDFNNKSCSNIQNLETDDLSIFNWKVKNRELYLWFK